MHNGGVKNVLREKKSGLFLASSAHMKERVFKFAPEL
jgi:hypothetical protein